MMRTIDLSKWKSSYAELYDIGGQCQFPIYGEGSGLQTEFCCMLYAAGVLTPSRLDGGEFPPVGKIIHDPDGWVYCHLRFSPLANQDAVYALLDETARQMGEISKEKPSLIKGVIFRARHKFRRMMAA